MTITSITRRPRKADKPATLKTRLHGIAESYASRRALRRDIAHYTSVRELEDLEAAIARLSADETGADETKDIRRVLAARRAQLTRPF